MYFWDVGLEEASDDSRLVQFYKAACEASSGNYSTYA